MVEKVSLTVVFSTLKVALAISVCVAITFPKAAWKVGFATITFPAVFGIFNFMAYSIWPLRLLSWASCGACDNKVINVHVHLLCEDSIGSEQSARRSITNRITWLALVISPDTVPVAPTGTVALRAICTAFCYVPATTHPCLRLALVICPGTVPVAPAGTVTLRGSA